MSLRVLDFRLHSLQENNFAPTQFKHIGISVKEIILLWHY